MKAKRKILAATLAIAVMALSFVCIPQENAQASDTSVVKYQTGIEYATFKGCIEAKAAPTCGLTDANNTGYLFAGWYQWDGTNVGAAITKLGDVTEESSVAAKFVPAHLAGIAYQVSADIDTTGVDETNFRVVSCVDSTNYQAVGFNVYGREQNPDTGVWEEWLMYKYDSETVNPAQSTKVYSGLNVYEGQSETPTVKYPKDVFGADAEGFKFTTMSLSQVPNTAYDTTIAVKPYWITLDGTVVEGMGEFNRINDRPSANNIVNISVNTKNAAAIAAGLLEVTYGTTNFEYVGYEPGRVFSEVEIKENTAGKIRCIGSVSDITMNASEANDVFINLRFQKTTSNVLGKGEANFIVSLPTVGGFCDNVEKPVTVSTWNVIY